MQELIHVSRTVFKVPFMETWLRLSDPTGFDRLYPNWVKAIKSIGGTEVQCIGPHGDLFTIRPHLVQEYGVLDFEVIDQKGETEWSRSRLFPLTADSCVLIHVVHRDEVAHLADIFGQDLNTFWDRYRKSIDDDFACARSAVENR